MTTPAGRAPARRRSLVLGLCASVLAATAALAPGGGALAGPPAPPGSHAGPYAGSHAGSHSGSHASRHTSARTTRVMTRNLYLGADLTPVLGALAGGDPAAIVGAATRTWAAVQATKPPERMAAIADEIVAARADVVGLQEVTRWTTDAFDPRDRHGGRRGRRLRLPRAAAGRAGGPGGGLPRGRRGDGAQLRLAPHPDPGRSGRPHAGRPARRPGRDHRPRLRAACGTHARTGTYQNVVSFPFNGSVLPVARGWGSVDVPARHARFRFVNSHLEAFGIPGVDAEAVRVAQVGELLAAQDAITAEFGRLPMVYVGDYNSDAPDAAAYSRLLAGVGQDAWTRSHRRAPGNTCCFDPALTDPTDPLTSRIDLVLTTPDVRAPRATVVGEEPADRTASGLWPSDHAGVVARLVLPAGRR